MNPLLITPIFELGKALIEKWFPDPAAAAQAQMELLKLTQQGDFKQLEADLQTALGQIQTNTAEAQSASNFRGGWRPFIGWVCGAGLAYQFLARPLGQALLDAFVTKPVTLTALDLDNLMIILGGMLGLGGFRTLERLKGKA